MSETKIKETTTIPQEAIGQFSDEREIIELYAADLGAEHPDVLKLREDLAAAEAAQRLADEHVERQKALSRAARAGGESKKNQRELLPLIQSVADSSFVEGSGYSILRFDVPAEEPEPTETVVGQSRRPYTIVNLIPYGGNDHSSGEPLDTVETGLFQSIEQIDRLTEGGGSENGGLADYGTSEIELDGQTLTVRRLKMDEVGARRVPIYAVYASDQARGEGEAAERILIVAQRTSTSEHGEIAAAMQGAGG